MVFNKPPIVGDQLPVRDQQARLQFHVKPLQTPMVSIVIFFYSRDLEPGLS